MGELHKGKLIISYKHGSGIGDWGLETGVDLNISEMRRLSQANLLISVLHDFA